MDIHLEKDTLGRDIVHGVTEKGHYLLNMAFVMNSYVDGRPWISSEGGVPASLSPPEAELLSWYAKKHPRAEPWIFAGEPPDG